MTAPHQRTARSGGDLRVLRAAVFAAVCVVLAAAGHTLASCATVPLWTLGAGFLGAVPGRGTARRTRALAAGHSGAARGRTDRAAHAVRAGAARGRGPATVDVLDADVVDVRRHARRSGPRGSCAGPPPRRSARPRPSRILADARLHSGLRATGTAMDMGSMHHPADALSARRFLHVAAAVPADAARPRPRGASPPAGCCAAGTWRCCGSRNCPRCRRIGSPKGRSYGPCAGRSRWCAPCVPGCRARPRRARARRTPPCSRRPRPVPPHSSTR